jgi:hypothetical protein
MDIHVVSSTQSPPVEAVAAWNRQRRLASVLRFPSPLANVRLADPAPRKTVNVEAGRRRERAAIIGVVLAMWPRLDRRALTRAQGDVRRIAHVVSIRTNESIEVVAAMIDRALAASGAED